MVLAVLSVVGGWVGLPDGLALGQPRSATSWRRSTGAPARATTASTLGEELLLMVDRDRRSPSPASALAYVFYVRLPGLPTRR